MKKMALMHEHYRRMNKVKDSFA